MAHKLTSTFLATVLIAALGSLPIACGGVGGQHEKTNAKDGAQQQERGQQDRAQRERGKGDAAGGSRDAWLSWRGPNQNGTSIETGLPEAVHIGQGWAYELSGRGCPVVADGRLYAMGYRGEGPGLEELLVCLDAKTGKLVWEHVFKDFLSDIIYYRFAIGSPTVDAETRNVYCMTTSGLLCCFSSAGKLLWEHSLMSEYGRLTFPNGRTGAAFIDDDLVIIHGIFSGWGKQAPARSRFFAFDKKTGVNVWSSTPGGPPKDSSFCMPPMTWENGRRVCFAGLGGGHVACVDIRSGEVLWRFRMCTGGVNSSPLLYKDTLIAIHGKENMDSSQIGRMVAIRRGKEPAPGAPMLMLGKDDEIWRNDLVAFTSSPVLVGNRVYQTTMHGELWCIDVDSGKKLWHKRLAPDQIHASPTWGDKKLYVPMTNGSFHIVYPSDKGGEVLQSLQLEGNCLGAPAIANGWIYVHTTEKLYAFSGGRGTRPDVARDSKSRRAPGGKPAKLQVIPADSHVKQGDTVVFRARTLDAKSMIVADTDQLEWPALPAGYTMEGNTLKIAKDAKPAALTLKVKSGGLLGTVRLRVAPLFPYSDDFEDLPVGKQRPHWVSSGRKWEVMELDGNKVLAKPLGNPLFQRTLSPIGHHTQKNYTAQVDIMTDGNRRSMSTAGLVNQRYQIALKGNHQTLEVSSNKELLKKNVRFRWRAKTWYTLKTRVDVNPDGSGVVRAKVWKRDTAEPDSWTLEVPVPKVHKNGAPGIYGFVPQNRFRVYLDNLKITPND